MYTFLFLILKISSHYLKKLSSNNSVFSCPGAVCNLVQSFQLTSRHLQWTKMGWENEIFYMGQETSFGFEGQEGPDQENYNFHCAFTLLQRCKSVLTLLEPVQLWTPVAGSTTSGRHAALKTAVPGICHTAVGVLFRCQFNLY